jgi:transcription termination factor NusB
MNSVIKRRKRCPSKKINFTEKSTNISSSPSNSTSSSSCTDEELESESTVKKVMISTLTLPPVYNSNLKSLNSQRSELQKQVNRLSKLLSNTISRLSEVDEAILRLQKQSNEDQLVANSLLSLSNSYPITLIGQSIKHA